MCSTETNCVNYDTCKECDYYELLNNEQDIEVQYQGEYMKQYSWAEVTAAELQKRKIQTSEMSVVNPYLYFSSATFLTYSFDSAILC